MSIGTGRVKREMATKTNKTFTNALAYMLDSRAKNSIHNLHDYHDENIR